LGKQINADDYVMDDSALIIKVSRVDLHLRVCQDFRVNFKK
jgi:hypothetical protein